MHLWLYAMRVDRLGAEEDDELDSRRISAAASPKLIAMGGVEARRSMGPADAGRKPKAPRWIHASHSRDRMRIMFVPFFWPGRSCSMVRIRAPSLRGGSLPVPTDGRSRRARPGHRCTTRRCSAARPRRPRSAAPQAGRWCSGSQVPGASGPTLPAYIAVPGLHRVQEPAGAVAPEMDKSCPIGTAPLLGPPGGHIPAPSRASSCSASVLVIDPAAKAARKAAVMTDDLASGAPAEPHTSW